MCRDPGFSTFSLRRQFSSRSAKFSSFLFRKTSGGVCETRKLIFGCWSRLQSCNTLCSCRKKTSHGTMENNIGCSDLTFSFHLDTPYIQTAAILLRLLGNVYFSLKSFFQKTWFVNFWQSKLQKWNMLFIERVFKFIGNEYTVNQTNWGGRSIIS